VALGAASRHPRKAVYTVSIVISVHGARVSTRKVIRRVKVKRRFVIDDRVTVEFLGQEDSIL
jgi:hypothetical protein